MLDDAYADMFIILINLGLLHSPQGTPRSQSRKLCLAMTLEPDGHLKPLHAMGEMVLTTPPRVLQVIILPLQRFLSGDEGSSAPLP
jgi:hypothetical protein